VCGIQVTSVWGGTPVLSPVRPAVFRDYLLIDAQRLFGDPDYLVRIATRESFQRLYDASLAALPGVLRLSTTLIMKEVVSDRTLPVAR